MNGLVSPDGMWRWDGEAWQPTEPQSGIESSGSVHAQASGASDNETRARGVATEEALRLLNTVPLSPRWLRQRLVDHGMDATLAERTVNSLRVDWPDVVVRMVVELLQGDGLSRVTLAKALRDRGFAHKHVEAALSRIDPDWGEQARRAAGRWLNGLPCSHSELLKYLTKEGFTREAAIQGIAALRVDWAAQASRVAQSTLEGYGGFSRPMLARLLETAGFDVADVRSALTQVRIDWAAQARVAALDLIECDDLTRGQVVAELESQGFDQRQAQRAARAVGL